MDDLKYEGGITIRGADGESNGHLVGKSRLGDIELQVLAGMTNVASVTNVGLSAMECRELAGMLREMADAADRYQTKQWTAADVAAVLKADSGWVPG